MRFLVYFDWSKHHVVVAPVDEAAQDRIATCVAPWIAKMSAKREGALLGPKELRDIGATLHLHLRSIRDGWYVHHESDEQWPPINAIPHDEPIEVDVQWDDPPAGPPPVNRWEFR